MQVNLTITWEGVLLSVLAIAGICLLVYLIILLRKVIETLMNKVFGISVITDLGVEGKIIEITHEDVQKAADAAQPLMTTIMRELINRA